MQYIRQFAIQLLHVFQVVSGFLRTSAFLAETFKIIQFLNELSSVRAICLKMIVYGQSQNSLPVLLFANLCFVCIKLKTK